MRKRKYTPMLLTIFESQITVNQVKTKETVLLNDCIIDYDTTITPNLTETNKFKLKIMVPQTKVPIERGGKYNTHIFGCSSDELRKEWIFVLQIIRSYEGTFCLRSSLNYLDKQKKLSIWHENIKEVDINNNRKS